MEITLNLSEEQWQKMTFIQQHSSENILALLEITIAVFSRMRGNKILERLTVKDSNTPHPCDYRYINQQYEKLQVSDPDSIKGWQESGFIGCGKSDADLSTNYKKILKETWSRKHDYS
jgi:hypothetical protein